MRRLATEFDQVEKIFTALRVSMEDDALIKGSRFLRSKSALIPVIDYLLQNARWSGPKNKQESTSLRQFLYMAFFTRLFPAPDSPLDQIHDAILWAKGAHQGVFPISEVSRVIIGREKKGTYEFREEYLADHDLILNIVQGGVKETSRMPLGAWNGTIFSRKSS